MTLREYLCERFYPGLISRGYSAKDGTKHFYEACAPWVKEGAVILDYGAGRGATVESLHPELKALALFEGMGVRRIGVDIDPAVMENRYLNEAHLLKASGNRLALPLEDNSVDGVIADWVLEHLESPILAFDEIQRVLKPGGFFAFRTVNRRHYIAQASLAMKVMGRYSGGKTLLQVLQPGRASHDIYPTFYRCNTITAIRHTAHSAMLRIVNFEQIEGEPRYLMAFSPLLAFGIGYERMAGLLPLPRAAIIGVAKKEPK